MTFSGLADVSSAGKMIVEALPCPGQVRGGDFTREASEMRGTGEKCDSCWRIRVISQAVFKNAKSIILRDMFTHTMYFGWHYSHHVVWVKTPSSASCPTKHPVLGPVRTMLLRKASWKKWKTWRWVPPWCHGPPCQSRSFYYAGAGRVHPKKERRLPTSSNPQWGW